MKKYRLLEIGHDFLRLWGFCKLLLLSISQADAPVMTLVELTEKVKSLKEGDAVCVELRHISLRKVSVDSRGGGGMEIQ